MGHEKDKPVIEHLQSHAEAKELILYNDDYNTFDYVIDTLIEVLGHDPHQAEQCAWIAHVKGKCAVKSGDFVELKPPCEELLRRNLTAEIE